MTRGIRSQRAQGPRRHGPRASANEEARSEEAWSDEWEGMRHAPGPWARRSACGRRRTGFREAGRARRAAAAGWPPAAPPAPARSRGRCASRAAAGRRSCRGGCLRTARSRVAAAADIGLAAVLGAARASSCARQARAAAAASGGQPAAARSKCRWRRRVAAGGSNQCAPEMVAVASRGRWLAPLYGSVIMTSCCSVACVWVQYSTIITSYGGVLGSAA